VKGCGNKSASDQRASEPEVVMLVIWSSGANSTSACLQMPHGDAGSSASVTITSSVK
jgi:hypothetical protein